MDYSFEIVGGTRAISDIDEFMSNIQAFSKKNSIIIQCFNADLIYNKIHLESTIFHAIRAYDEKRMSTNSIEMELLLYAAGERQVKKALPKIGIKKGENNIAIVFILLEKNNEDLKSIIDRFIIDFQINVDDSVLNGSRDVLIRFGLTPLMIDTVSEEDYDGLILEQIALVDIIK